jgi:hypothetical protein
LESAAAVPRSRRWILSATVALAVAGSATMLGRWGKVPVPPLSPGELRERGDRLVTERMALLFDRKAYPGLVRALGEKVSRDEVPFWTAEVGRQGAGSEGARLARLYRAVAAGEWGAAKAGPEDGVLGLALEALGDGLRPGSILSARPWEKAVKGEEEVWLGVMVFLERRAPRPRVGAGGPREPKAHPVLKRVEAAVREGAGEKGRARELLEAAIAARPDYLAARMELARLKSEAGDAAGAAAERAEVERRASALGLTF